MEPIGIMYLVMLPKVFKEIKLQHDIGDSLQKLNQHLFAENLSTRRFLPIRISNDAHFFNLFMWSIQQTCFYEYTVTIETINEPIIMYDFTVDFIYLISFDGI